MATLSTLGREVSQWYIILGIFSSCTSPLLRRTVHLADVFINHLLGLWAIQVDGEAVLSKSEPYSALGLGRCSRVLFPMDSPLTPNRLRFPHSVSSSSSVHLKAGDEVWKRHEPVRVPDDLFFIKRFLPRSNYLQPRVIRDHFKLL